MIPEYAKRRGAINRREAPLREPKEKVLSSDKYFPSTGHDLLAILAKFGVRQNYLTGEMVNELTNKVVTIQGKEEPLPPPEKEKQAHPDDWAKFINDIPVNPVFQKKHIENKVRITPRAILDIMRGYDWKGGWLQYKHTQIEIVGVDEEWM